ncbi:TonB-dependent receptor [Zunongwangia sp. F260]|uniref:TonB-dependent receptor n=1 Tax=Autumnicola lenta TaxID=3075593 RepID=A0ABU3CLU5_9FLAO|nr:TonB-dependent receptor [Zunongwangia sp. F260]MDT0647329.1 TonB-dependent receptor [Zunongwangia sp. F260]
MKTSILFLILLSYGFLHAQQTVNGRVTDRHNNPVFGANVYLSGTYDGTTSAEDGSFEFKTSETGLKTLVISFISFQEFKKSTKVSAMRDLVIVLREDVGALDAVVLSAGTFSAGDNSSVSVLKPLDIVTTAGVAGDFIAALQTLPGTQTVGEDGRLFVRGGTAEETQVFIDGLRVFQPYAASANNLPTRGRYSPFLFDGITFSTGGYSAEYGQALSSVLLLNTINEPDQTETNISIMSVGAGAGHVQKWKESSLSLNASYINLAPYLELIPNNKSAQFEKPYEGLGGEAVFRKQLSSGLLKFYSAYEYSNFEILQPDLNSSNLLRFKLKNGNFYTNTSYKGNLGNGWSVNPGASISHAANDALINDAQLSSEEKAANLKMGAAKRFNSYFKLKFGAEALLKNFSEKYREEEQFNSEFTSTIYAFYTEGDILFSKNFALKAGLRGSYLNLSEDFQVSPRLSLAYKLKQGGQFSLAYGKFLQEPQNLYLKYDHNLNPENATHYIFNYQWSKPGYTFRAETYYKDYEELVKYNTEEPLYNSAFVNSGSGYATGVDIFFRDNKSLKNFEYWLSYSFIDSKRNFRNYPQKVTPDFVADHSASLVMKYWLEDIRSQVGLTYNFSSGRPYENPNTLGFMNEKTGTYNNLSFNWAYLISQQKILYFSVSNLLGSKNIHGYEYADNPGVDGRFAGRAITPPADRFFFIGFFWTISKDKSQNQLDNL